MFAHVKKNNVKIYFMASTIKFLPSPFFNNPYGFTLFKTLAKAEAVLGAKNLFALMY